MAVQLHFASGRTGCIVRAILGLWLACVMGGLEPNTRAAEPAPALPTLDETVAKLEKFSLDGKVIDQEGAPVQGAEVFLYYCRNERGYRDRLAGKVQSSSDGSFNFEKSLVWEPISPGNRPSDTQRYFVIARHPDHGLEFATVLKGDPTEGVVVQLQGVRTWWVTAVDTQGKPVEGARVYLCGGSHSSSVEKKLEREHRYLTLMRDVGICAGVTDANGKVLLMGTPRDATFRVIKDGYAYGWYRDRITLLPGATVTGRVTYPDGTPASGLAVRFEYQGDRLMADDVTSTDEQGRYEFRHAPASGYRFGYMADDQQKDVQGVATLKVDDLRPGSIYSGKKISFPIQPGQAYTKDLQLARSVVLAGTVVDFVTGQPISNIQLNAYIQTEGTRYLDSIRLKSDADGKFRATVAPGSQVSFQWDRSEDGQYIIDEEWRQQGNWQPVPQQVYNSDKTDLVLKIKLWQVGKLTGRVVDTSGKVVQGVMVHLHSEVPPVKTDASGVFTLKAAPRDRDFDLCAISEDMTLGGVVRLKAGATEAVITVGPTVEYNGVVTNTDGLPAGNLQFYLDLDLNDRSLYRVREEPKTDAEGKFKAKHLIPGAKYKAWWSSDNETNRDYDYGNASIDLSKLKPDEAISFQAMQYTNALIGRVVNEKDEPISGAVVATGYTSLLPQDVRFNRQQITTDKQGEFTISRLAPGSLQIRVAAPGYKNRTFSVPTDSIDFKAVLKSASEPSRCEVTVVDEEGKPIKNAPVVLRIVRIDQKGKRSTENSVHQADEAGKVSFIVPPQGDTKGYRQMMLCCDLDGRDLAFCRVQDNEDISAQLIAPKSSRHWRGQVVDQAGKPITGATIRVTGYNPNRNDSESHVSLDNGEDDEQARKLSMTSDAEGRFELQRIGRNWTNIKITAKGFGGPDRPVFDPGQDEGKEFKTFTLPPAAVVKGRVIVKSTGQPPSEPAAGGVYIQNTRVGGGAEPVLGSDWTFTADELSAGTYQVRIGFYGMPSLRKYVCPAPPQFVAEAGKTTEVVIELEEGIALRGKLLNAKTQQALEARVLGRNKVDPNLSAWAEVEKDGSWEMYLPRDGQYDLLYYVPGWQRYESFKTVTVQKGQGNEDVLMQVDPDAKKAAP